MGLELSKRGLSRPASLHFWGSKRVATQIISSALMDKNRLRMEEGIEMGWTGPKGSYIGRTIGRLQEPYCILKVCAAKAYGKWEGMLKNMVYPEFLYKDSSKVRPFFKVRPWIWKGVLFVQEAIFCKRVADPQSFQVTGIYIIPLVLQQHW